MRFSICLIIASLITLLTRIKESNLQHPYSCIFIDELFVDPLNHKCMTFDCWSAQLLDSTRLQLISIFNQYKQEVAKGECSTCSGNTYSGVYNMQYHWYLELIAIHYLNIYGCKNQDQQILDKSEIPRIKILEFESFRFDDIQSYKYAVTSFRLNVYGKQGAVTTQLRNHMKTNASKIIFQSWDGNKYLFGGALYIGCSMIMKERVNMLTGLDEEVNNASIVYLACAFASLKTSMDSSPGPTTMSACTQSVTEEAHNLILYNPNTNLCNVTLSFDTHQYFPCRFYYSTPSHDFRLRCPTPIPSVWEINAKPDVIYDSFNIILYPNNTSMQAMITIPAEVSPTETIFPTIVIIDPKTVSVRKRVSSMTTKSAFSTTDGVYPPVEGTLSVCTNQGLSILFCYPPLIVFIFLVPLMVILMLIAYVTRFM